MGNKVAILPMSCKPMHRGHEAMLNIACSRNDTVILVTSLSTRSRPGEIVVEGERMMTVWDEYMTDRIDKRVRIVFTGGLPAKNDSRHEFIARLGSSPTVDTPVGWTWFLLGNCDSIYGTDTTYEVYTGHDDRERFSDELLERFVQRLLRPIRRIKIVTVGDERRLFAISGSDMRSFLVRRDRASFIDNLPDFLKEEDKDAVYELLASMPIAPHKNTRKR